MKFGLKPRDIRNIKIAIDNFPEIEEIIIFGSRVIGNYKTGSDIDIAIKGNKITAETVNRLSGILNNELPIPFFFDIINYNTISNNELKKHIDNEGKILIHINNIVE